jgi:hypothetical protein
MTVSTGIQLLVCVLASCTINSTSILDKLDSKLILLVQAWQNGQHDGIINTLTFPSLVSKYTDHLEILSDLYL